MDMDGALLSVATFAGIVVGTTERSLRWLGRIINLPIPKEPEAAKNGTAVADSDCCAHDGGARCDAARCDAADAVAEGTGVAARAENDIRLLESDPLMGQDKWLGGVLGSDGCVYGVPGHAKTVLRVDPTTDTVSTLGGPFEGKYKWLRGNLHHDGCIYCIPCHASTILKIDCNTTPPTLSEMGGPHPGDWKWHGGVLSPYDKCIYGIPQFAETVLKIDPLRQVTSEIGGPFPGASPTGKHKWYGGLLGGDGCIYGVPQNATSVLKINPFTQETTTFGELEAGGHKWHGGVTGLDGCIYGVPANADSVLKIDPFTQSVSTIPFSYRCHHRDDRKYKYLGGVLGPDGLIYCIPSDADYVLRVDPTSGTAVEIGPEIGTRATHCHISHNCNKWQNGFLAPDGLIYAIPLKASAVLRVDPATAVVDVVGGPYVGFDKWEGGVLSREGGMYCIPLKSKQVLKINPTGTGVARICDEDMAPEPDVDDDDDDGSGGGGGGGGGHGAEPPPDALLPYLSTGTALGRSARERLETDGYLVLRGILTAAECAEELERLWDYVQTVSPAVRRSEPESWYPAAAGGGDPWPHAGWKSFADMFQDKHAGWLFGALREKLAERVFEPLFGTDALHSSKEGFTFHRPTAGSAGQRHPSLHRTSHVCGAPSHTSGEHFDQSAAARGLQTVQSSTAFLDQAADDACFLCWPRSHKHHQELIKGTWRGRSPWVPLTDAECEQLAAAGLRPTRVPVRKGDVILWRSDLVHAAAPPRGERTGFRAVAYVSMAPAVLTPRHVSLRKVEAYQRRHTGDHHASREAWHEARPSKGAAEGGEGGESRPAFQPYFAHGPPKLTARQAQLYGLVGYRGAEGGEGVTVIHDTPS